MGNPDKNPIKLKETVTVRKFDHTHEDRPTEPFEVVVHESVTEISEVEAMMLGFVPQSERVQVEDMVEVRVINAGDSGGIGGAD